MNNPDFLYVAKRFNPNYSPNANANQKPRLVEDFIHGRLTGAVRRDTVVCTYSSNEKAMLKVLLWQLVSHRRYLLFCWDPPGVTVRDRRTLICRFRCWLMDRLFAMIARRSVGVILNLHPGFLEGRFDAKTRDKFRAFPNGTDVAANQRSAEGVGHVRKRIAINSGFRTEKGAWEIAKLVLRLWESDHEVSVAWVGHGGERDAIVAYLQKKGMPAVQILAPGKVPNEEAMRLLASGEIAFNAYPDIPSLRWNYVLKAPEFLSLGLPIVSVDLPGVREYVREGGAGRLFQPDDWDGAFKVVSELLQSPEDVARMRQHALEFVQDYDWDKINSRIADWVKGSIGPSAEI